jgi:hypothetical protein
MLFHPWRLAQGFNHIDLPSQAPFSKDRTFSAEVGTQGHASRQIRQKGIELLQDHRRK